MLWIRRAVNKRKSSILSPPPITHVGRGRPRPRKVCCAAWQSMVGRRVRGNQRCDAEWQGLQGIVISEVVTDNGQRDPAVRKDSERETISSHFGDNSSIDSLETSLSYVSNLRFVSFVRAFDPLPG